jgi:two-component system OmpR family response regulator
MAAIPDILVVDDDTSIGAGLRDYLSGFRFNVRTAGDGREMDEALARGRPDLIILDVMLPEETGLAICQRLGRLCPVLMLSAAGEASDRFVGLELGADDYLAKPFEPRELLARVRALLRRSEAAGPAPGDGGRVLFAGWAFSAADRLLLDPGGARVALTPGEHALLQAFVMRAGRILTRDRLLEDVHGPLADSFDRAIDLAIGRLRRKLAWPGQAMLIETVRGAGYRFLPEVRRG